MCVRVRKRACVRACARACVCVCVCLWGRLGDGEGGFIAQKLYLFKNTLVATAVRWNFGSNAGAMHGWRQQD